MLADSSILIASTLQKLASISKYYGEYLPYEIESVIDHHEPLDTHDSLFREQEVAGSNPVAPTRLTSCTARGFVVSGFVA